MESDHKKEGVAKVISALRWIIDGRFTETAKRHAKGLILELSKYL